MSCEDIKGVIAPCRQIPTWEESQENTLKMYRKTGNYNAFDKHIEYLLEVHDCNIEYSTSNIDNRIYITKPIKLYR